MQIIQDKEQYFSLIQDFEYVPFSQSEGWYQFHNCMKPDSIIFLIDNIELPNLACYGHVKTLLGVKMLLIEGECRRHLAINAKIITQFFRDIQSLGYDIIETVSNSPYEVNYEIGFRQAGYLRPVGLFSMPLSLWVNLSNEIRFNDNWKRNLKLASKADLSFQIIENPGDDEIRLFFELYKELIADKQIGHNLSISQISALLTSSDFGFATVRSSADEILSAIIFHKSARHAGLLYAAKSSLAKECGATFFMYKELFIDLQEKGFEIFDMEKLVPSTHSTNNVFLFKQGVRGKYIFYNGEWSWYKRPIYRPLMYFVKRFIMKKREI